MAFRCALARAATPTWIVRRVFMWLARVSRPTAEWVLARAQRQRRGGLSPVRFVRRPDHLQRRPRVSYAAHWLAIAFDGVDQVRGDAHVRVLEPLRVAQVGRHVVRRDTDGEPALLVATPARVFGHVHLLRRAGFERQRTSRPEDAYAEARRRRAGAAARGEISGRRRRRRKPAVGGVDAVAGDGADSLVSRAHVALARGRATFGDPR